MPTENSVHLETSRSSTREGQGTDDRYLEIIGAESSATSSLVVFKCFAEKHIYKTRNVTVFKINMKICQKNKASYPTFWGTCCLQREAVYLLEKILPVFVVCDWL